jgi:WD40 repeat protein
MTADGTLAAVSGWTRTTQHYVMLFETGSGRMITELGPLGNVVNRVAFSPNGRYLAAVTGQGQGAHAWERHGAAEWRKVLTDDDFGGKDAYGVAFGPDNRAYAAGDNGTLRRYGRDFRREVKIETKGGREPSSIAVHPDGKTLAVGYDDTSAVDIYDAETLRHLHTADPTGIERGALAHVAWSRDGRTLWASSTVAIDSTRIARAFGDEGRGPGRSFQTPATNTVRQIIACRGGIALASADSGFGLIDADGKPVSWMGAVTVNMRRKIDQAFLVSDDGLTVRFGLEYGGDAPVLLDLGRAQLTESTTPPPVLKAPRTSGLAVTDWKDDRAPKLGGTVLPLYEYETSRSLAITADAGKFVLGTDWNLRAYDRTGKELWRKPSTGTVWGVTLTARDTIMVAALGDGTLRWHRMSDGAELLAVFVHAKNRTWVAWTPGGYYMASEGGGDLIGWHQNRGFGQAATFSFVSERRTQYMKPDVVRRAITNLGR